MPENKAPLRSLFPSAKGAPGTEPCLVQMPRRAVSLPSSGSPADPLQGQMLTSSSTDRWTVLLQHPPQVVDPHEMTVG